MKYTRDWELVEDVIAALWINASDRPALTEAANRLDRLLANEAHLVGESRDGDTRIAFDPPLGILFDVNLADRTVVVWRLWRTHS